MHSLPASLVTVFLGLISRATAAGFCNGAQLPQDYRSWPDALPGDIPWEQYQSVDELCIGPSYDVPNFGCCNTGGPQPNCQVPVQWQNDPARADQLKSFCSQCTCNPPSKPPPIVDEFGDTWDDTVQRGVTNALQAILLPGINCDQALGRCRSSIDCIDTTHTKGCSDMACSVFGRRSTRRPNGRPKPRTFVGRCAPRDYITTIRKNGPGGGFGGGGFGGGLIGKRSLEEIVFTGACHCNATFVHDDCCNAPDGLVSAIDS
jgi:hypothetical protein